MTHHECTRDVAPERARAEEQTPGVRDLLEVESGQDAPAHELEVQVDSLVRKSTEHPRKSLPRLGYRARTSSGPSSARGPPRADQASPARSSPSPPQPASPALPVPGHPGPARRRQRGS